MSRRPVSRRRPGRRLARKTDPPARALSVRASAGVCREGSQQSCAAYGQRLGLCRKRRRRARYACGPVFEAAPAREVGRVAAATPPAAPDPRPENLRTREPEPANPNPRTPEPEHPRTSRTDNRAPLPRPSLPGRHARARAGEPGERVEQPHGQHAPERGRDLHEPRRQHERPVAADGANDERRHRLRVERARRDRAAARPRRAPSSRSSGRRWSRRRGGGRRGPARGAASRRSR